MPLTDRDCLGTAGYWDERAGRPGLSAVMWPNCAFNACVDRRQKDVISRLLPDVSGKTVLDIGCGTGRLALFLADRGAEVVGVDFSPAMVSRARRQLQRHPDVRVRFIQASIEDLSSVGDGFDYVMSVGCLCIAASRRTFGQVIGGMCRLVRPDGAVLLIEPLHRWWPLRRVGAFGVPDCLGEFARRGFAPAAEDRMIFVPVKFACGLLPVPSTVTRMLFEVGERVLRRGRLARRMADYTVLFFRRARSTKSTQGPGKVVAP
jgi:SAM-dependent methyltransferase